MIAAEVLALLCCPETRQPLTVAPAEIIDQLTAASSSGRLCDRSGNPSAAPAEGGLLRADGALFFPIRDGIPILLLTEAVALPLERRSDQ